MKIASKKPYWLWYPLLLSPFLQAADSAGFARTVQPFLARNCYLCHNAKQKTGGLNLEAYQKETAVTDDRELWEKLQAKLRSSEMPPKGTPRPDPKELQSVIQWIETEFDRADRATKPNPGRVTAHRLNRAEYNNTVRDLLGVDTEPANDFPQDDSVYGFDNIAEALSVSPLLMEKYLAVAERIAQTAVFGPRLKTVHARFELPVPRRMEFTNVVRITKPAYYSVTDYDVTGLSQPGSLHMTHRFPADGEYVFQLIAAGNRPAGSEPGECTFWLDGKLVKTFEVPDVQMSGFEKRPDHWDVRLKVTAGSHQIEAAFPKQFEGLPPKFGGSNPSPKPTPPLVDPATLPPLPADAPWGKREERRIAIEKYKEQLRHPTFEGLSVMDLDIVGPHEYKKAPSPESLRKVYTCGHLNGAHQPGCERRILSSLATRGFRRAATAQEIDGLVAIAEGSRKRGGSFEDGISLAVETILVSPDFLFRVETGDANATDAVRSISEYELASRLSYFLWSSMPDEELLACAARGTLGKPHVLEAQVRRMLADPKSRALANNFAGEWLEIRRLESVQPDRDRFPDFDDYLRQSMRRETELFFQNMIQEDRAILDLIDGRYTFVNERLARHYGIRSVSGTGFQKVDLSGTGRSGILTQASILTVSSYATRTSPVLRGKWILENILNAPPPPPPANVPSLDESAAGSSASLRRQLEEHRKNAVCASCHARMDPLGFALENYDAVGAWRDRDGAFPVDPTGVLPDGRDFQGAAGLKTILKEDRDAFARCLTEKLLVYALGRGLERYDRPAVSQIVGRGAADQYRFSSFILGIVNSVPFQMQGAGGKS